MKDIKAVIFDMDGVIFDTERLYLKTWEKIFDEYGYTMTKEIYTSVMGSGRDNVKKTFLKIYGDSLPIEEMYLKKDIMIKESIKNGEVSIKDGALEILNFLKENNIKIALATSATKKRVTLQLKLSHIEHLFDTVVCKDDIKNAKPDPEIFLKAAELLFEKPQNCIVIEDSLSGIKAAYNGNITAFHVVDLKKPNKEILEYSYKSFRDLFEIKEEIEGILKR
ncbi:HAD family phosphatase [Clostridium sp. BJN0001]|uniref:HAD family hydrolase n=1 Tax=Clostridium sp. BJN0001 TaxID=2930219 RepID=UPI001FD507C2|nr:HAD family phosphatase [Clostridium sp. BJN0001]